MCPTAHKGLKWVQVWQKWYLKYVLLAWYFYSRQQPTDKFQLKLSTCETLQRQLVFNFDIAERKFLLIFYPNFAYHFSSRMILLWNCFLYIYLHLEVFQFHLNFTKFCPWRDGVCVCVKLNVCVRSLVQVIPSLQWRHNGHDSVSNHQPHHCLLNRLSGRRSKKTSKIGVTGLCVGNSPETGEFPTQMASNAENVSI